MNRGRVSHWRRAAWIGAAILSTCGCSLLPSQGSAEKPATDSKNVRPGDETFIDAAQYERSGKSTTLPFSVSDRGREIERDFGIR